MPNLIDKLFRKKLQERNFHPEAGDWAAMNELIDKSMGTGGPTPGSSGAGFSLNWLAIAVVSVSTALGIYFAVDYVKKDKNLPERVKLESPQKTNSNNSNSINSKEYKTAQTSIKSSSESVVSEDGYIDAQQNSINKIPSSEISLLSQINEEENKLRVEDASRLNKNSLKNEIDNSTDFNSIISGTTTQVDRYVNNSSPIANKFDAKELSASQDFNEADNKVNGYFNNEESEGKPNAFNKNRTSNTKTNRSYNNTDFESALETDNIITIPKNLYLSSESISSFNTIKLQTIKPLTKDNSDVFKVQNRKSKRTLPLQLSLAAFGEISYITKNITGDMEYAALIRRRSNEEKNIFTAGGGLEFQVKYKQIGLSSGFAISNWGENVQYEDQNTSSWDVSSTTESDTTWTEEIVFTYDSVFIDTMWVVFYDSSIVTVVDTILITTIYDSTEVETPLGLNAQNGKTTISYWEIPLYFSYQFDIGDFYITPGLGVNIGFLKVTSGYYLNENVDGLIQINTGYAVMRKTLLSGQVNLGVGYRLGDKFAIEATPIYRFNLGNVFEKGGISQKYSSLSLQFKLRYYF